MNVYPDVCSGMMQRAVNSYTPVMKQCVVTSCIVQWDKMGGGVAKGGLGSFSNVTIYTKIAMYYIWYKLV